MWMHCHEFRLHAATSATVIHQHVARFRSGHAFNRPWSLLAAECPFHRALQVSGALFTLKMCCVYIEPCAAARRHAICVPLSLTSPSQLIS